MKLGFKRLGAFLLDCIILFFVLTIVNMFVPTFGNVESLSDKTFEIMEEYVKVFDLNYPVICDCNRCLKGVTMGKANGVHLLDLIMGKQKSID